MTAALTPLLTVAAGISALFSLAALVVLVCDLVTSDCEVDLGMAAIVGLWLAASLAVGAESLLA